MTANALFLVASRFGDLSLVAPLAALYPVTTVLLALAVDRERLRALQVVGLVLALSALLLSLRTSVTATVLCVLAGVPLALVLARTSFPGHQLVRALVLLPLL